MKQQCQGSTSNKIVHFLLRKEKKKSLAKEQDDIRWKWRREGGGEVKKKKTYIASIDHPVL